MCKFNHDLLKSNYILFSMLNRSVGWGGKGEGCPSPPSARGIRKVRWFSSFLRVLSRKSEKKITRSRKYTRQNFMWVNGTSSSSTVSLWAPNEPNENEFCARLTVFGTIRGTSCGDEILYVCSRGRYILA